MNRAYITCDIDGVLAMRGAREAMAFECCRVDVPCEAIVQLLHLYNRARVEIVLLTGRDEQWEPQTKRWLEAHAVPYASLCMRPHGNNQDGDIVKEGLLLSRLMPEFKCLPILAIDDDPRVCVALGKQGIPTMLFTALNGIQRQVGMTRRKRWTPRRR